LQTSATDYSVSASSCAESARADVRCRILRAALLSWALVSCFNRLGDAPVFVANEAREGVYARAMLESGNFVAPIVANHLENGEVVADKPPLTHWLSAAAAWAKAALSAGRPATGLEAAQAFDEWTLRFPSALCACLLVWAVATLGAAFVGERAALFAAAALLTSAQFWYQARFGRVDMALACFASIAALLAGRALLEGRRRLLSFAALAAGAAMLAKGPLGVLLPVLACLAFAAVERLRGAVRSHGMPWRGALAVLCAVVVPWYALAILSSNGAILRSQLFAENLDQFTGANGRMSDLFYLGPWLLDSLPWNLIAVAALPWIWRRRDRGAIFCAAWWLVVLAFFELAAYKRRAYLLPALPAEALIAGWLVDRLGERIVGTTPFARRAFVSLWAAAAIAYALIVPVGMTHFARRTSPKPLIQRIDAAVPAATRLAVCGLGHDSSLVLLFYFRDPKRVDVAPDGTSCVSPPDGYYLLTDEERRRAERRNDGGRSTELLHGELRGWSRRVPVTLVVRGTPVLQTARGADSLRR